MSLLAKALDVDFTFYNGTSYQSEVIHTILERARYMREREGVILKSTSDLTKLAPGEPLPQSSPDYPFDKAALLRGADVTEPAGADLWVLPADDPRAPKPALPPAPKPDTRPRIHQIMGDLENTKRFMADPNLPFEDVRPSVVACWNSHYSVIRRFAVSSGAEDGAILVMEDDVDMEFDIEATLRAEMEGLPADWDMILPGYCDSTETDHRPEPGHPRLRRSHHPLCNHGYIVSRRGARRMVSLFRSPMFAYSRPHDQAKQFLIRQGLSESKFTFFHTFPCILKMMMVLHSQVILDHTCANRPGAQARVRPPARHWRRLVGRRPHRLGSAARRDASQDGVSDRRASPGQLKVDR